MRPKRAAIILIVSLFVGLAATLAMFMLRHRIGDGFLYLIPCAVFAMVGFLIRPRRPEFGLYILPFAILMVIAEMSPAVSAAVLDTPWKPGMLFMAFYLLAQVRTRGRAEAEH